MLRWGCISRHSRGMKKTEYYFTDTVSIEEFHALSLVLELSFHVESHAGMSCWETNSKACGDGEFWHSPCQGERKGQEGSEQMKV